MRKWIAGFGIVTLLYGGLMGIMAALESKFLFFPDYPTRVVSPPEASLRLEYRVVKLGTEDHVRLSGWLVPSEADRGVIIFFHGNAGNIGDRVHRYVELNKLGYGVLAVDYRGYGDSEGVPDESGLYKDAMACYRYVADTLGTPATRIVLYGQSLGSAVAVDLATRVTHAALVVEGAFTSAADRGQELYPFLPVRWMMRNRFDSLKKIPGIRTPKLFIHARSDEVIPVLHGRKLFEAAVEPKKFLELRGGHNDCEIVDADRLYHGLQEFLSEFSDPIRR